MRASLISTAAARLFVLTFLAASAVNALVPGPWSDVTLTPDQRAGALVKEMRQDEKLVMLHGPPTGPCCQCTTNASCAYVGNVLPNSRLDIPPITMNDGPQGFRDNNNPATTTAWPSGLTMAASFDEAAMLEWGTGMGKEFLGKGSNVQLGPGLCLARVPRNGRNFEYLSGEDPYLGYVLVQPVVQGIQSQKVVACVKHYALNNQETSRNSVSELADERTRFEMYYPPFAGAVAAEAGSVMCSYNKINGIWSCENPITLAKDYKQTTGFKGYVMSDWGATHSTSIMAGLDIEMPAAKFMNPEAITAGIRAQNITQAAVDESVFRILRAMFQVGVMDVPTATWDWSKLKNNVTTEASITSARHLSAISTVLLKNEGGVLPLPKDKKLALIGFVDKGAVVHGGGSGSVAPSHIVSPLEGITAAVGDTATITHSNGTDIEAAAALAAKSDFAVVFVGTLSHEGGDRASLSLDDGCEPDTRPGHDSNQCLGNNHEQNALVAAVAKANKNTVVVLSIPGAILMPWSPDVPAILTNFMPGQQAGNAIADVLFGSVNPSAKLPITMPNKENEQNFQPDQWPGLPDPKNPSFANYTEKLQVGYRYYDSHKLQFTTGFPFGHGLSYTSFEYSSMKVSPDQVIVTVKNSGKVAGSEVAQMYLAFPEAAGEPPLQLKGFKKTSVLAVGAVETIVFSIKPLDTSVWDVSSGAFQQVKGTFGVSVGSSSRDIRETGTFSQ